MGADLSYQPPIYRRQDGAMVVRDAGRLVSEDTLWGNCPLLNWLLNPTIGVHLAEDWQRYDAAATDGDYVLTQATAGTAAVSTAASGVLELDSGSSTSTQGANLQRVKSPFVLAAGKGLWFEARVKVVDTFDKVELFVGLSEIDTSIIAASANSSANHIGFECVTDDGLLVFVSEKASARGTTTGVQLAEDTYVDLGFYCDGLTTIQPYVNGVAVGTALVTANIPVVAVYPSFVCQSAGTNDPILHIAGYRVFQER